MNVCRDASLPAKPVSSTQVVRIKNYLVRRFGHQVPSADLLDYLEANAPEFTQARRSMFAGQLDWQNLKGYSMFCRFDTSPEDYQKWLERFDADLYFPEMKWLGFVGDGFGEDCLNSYRHVKIGQQDCFEKIYLKDSKSLQNLLIIDREVAPVLNAVGVKIPRIIESCSGSKLTSVYTELIIDHRPLEKHQTVDFYFAIWQKFKLIREQDVSCSFADFESHALYQDGLNKAKILVETWFPGDGGRRLMELIQLTRATLLVFSHGDFYHKNLSQDGSVFDWDRCGFYPGGFDLAYCLSKSIKNPSLPEWLEQMEIKLAENEVSSWMPALIFLSFIFFVRGTASKASDEFLKGLFLEAEKRFAEIRN